MPTEPGGGHVVTKDTTAGTRVGELVRQRAGSLSPAERKLATVLLGSYPIAGLETLARFAERAGVSPPTVTRFIAKLGFRGYPEFQDVLRSEVHARLSSPLARYGSTPSAQRLDSLLHDAFAVFEQNLQATLELVSQRDFEEVADLLADCRRRVLVLGGRVSSPLARYLAAQLNLLRPGISLVQAERATPAQQLIDLGKRDVLVAFDYRRYQGDTIETASVAAGQGCQVVLFTDPWLSPASASATHVLVTSVEAAAPFDSLVGATAILEALVAAVLARLGERGEERLRRMELLRAGSVWGAPQT